MKNNYEYEKNNFTRVSIKLCNNTDSDIIEALRTCGNKQGYIKALIREDNKRYGDPWQPITKEYLKNRVKGHINPNDNLKDY